MLRSRVNTDNLLGTCAFNRPRYKTCFVSQCCKVKLTRGTFRMSDSFICTNHNHMHICIYEITCKHCDLVYIGETRRSRSTGFCEHLKDVTVAAAKPSIFVHRVIKVILIWRFLVCVHGEETLGLVFSSNRGLFLKWIICFQRE